MLAVLEAVYSVAMSHSRGCMCTVCRAAAGDPQAMAKVVAELEAGEEPS